MIFSSAKSINTSGLPLAVNTLIFWAELIKYIEKKQTNNTSNNSDGFTFLEIIVIIVIVGILSAIAAPSWLTFISRQRVNKANDIVLSALQQAQGEARKKKLSYSAWFRENNGSLEYAIIQSDIPLNNFLNDNSVWKSITKEIGGNAKQIIMRTNLQGDNTAAPLANNNLVNPRRIIFDFQGALRNPAEFGASGGLKIVVAVPNGANPTQPSNTKRCVVVRTLLGNMSTERDDNCN